jgi:hypothetical protein
MQHTKTRQLMAGVEHEISVLRGLDPVTTVAIDWTGLGQAFADLSKHMALGPEPETRPCPACGQLGMRNATVCGYCWTKTPPQVSDSSKK